VVFLYKLKPGDCPASFGINVAKAVGIAPSIIKTAKVKANFFENNLGLNLIETTLKEYNNNLNLILS
jgi:DNA mismatch repair protein MSH6